MQDKEQICYGFRRAGVQLTVIFCLFDCQLINHHVTLSDESVYVCACARACLCLCPSEYIMIQVGGYRDLMICVIYEGVLGLRAVAEIQIQDEELFLLKRKVYACTRTLLSVRARACEVSRTRTEYERLTPIVSFGLSLSHLPHLVSLSRSPEVPVPKRRGIVFLEYYVMCPGLCDSHPSPVVRRCTSSTRFSEPRLPILSDP